VRQQLLQVPHHEAGHADGAQHPGLVQPLQRCPGGQALAGHRPVQQHKVARVQVQGLEAAPHRRLHGAGPLEFVPQLGGDEHVVAQQAAVAHRSPDRLLVAIDLRRVDVAVAGGQGFALGGVGEVGRGAEHAEADARHRGALVQRQRRRERRRRRRHVRHATFRAG
jgi:hypothetical protein